MRTGSDVFLDTFAWVEYFEGTQKGQFVHEAIDDATAVYTCPMVLAELYSRMCRREGPTEAAQVVDHVLALAAVVPHTAELGVRAGRIHADRKAVSAGFGMADAFVLAAARTKGVKVLTGDPHFEGLPDAELF